MENGGQTLGMEGPYLFNHHLVCETINQGFGSDPISTIRKTP